MISKIPKWIGNLAEGLILRSIELIQYENLSSNIKLCKFCGDIANMNFHPGNANAIRVSETDLRNYTVFNSDKAKGEFSIIFYLNNLGLGSKLISSLSVGNVLYMDSPRGKSCYDRNYKKQIFFGDETSLGLACALNSIFKSNLHQYQFFFELDKRNRLVPDVLGLNNFDILSKNDSSCLQAQLKIPDSQNVKYIITGNGKSVQYLRKKLKLNKFEGNIYSKGYWIEGKTGL